MHIRITLLLAIGFDGHIIAHGMGATGSHHHRLCLALHGRQRHLAELLYDDGTFLVDDVLVVVVVSLDRPCGRCLFIFRVIGDALCYLVTHLIRRVAQQHILDKPFLDGLHHRIGMESLVTALRRVNVLMGANAERA